MRGDRSVLLLLQAVCGEGQEWRKRALCRGVGPDRFYTGRHGVSQDNTAAKALCDACPVREECLEWALSVGEVNFGFWGGETARSRQAMRSRMRAADGLVSQ